MRLIDADRLKEVFNRNVASANVFNDIIDNQPTAYDVDKVVEQLEESSFASEICEEFKPGWFKNREVEALELKEAIEIVKGAVKDE